MNIVIKYYQSILSLTLFRVLRFNLRIIIATVYVHCLSLNSIFSYGNVLLSLSFLNFLRHQSFWKYFWWYLRITVLIVINARKPPNVNICCFVFHILFIKKLLNVRRQLFGISLRLILMTMQMALRNVWREVFSVRESTSQWRTHVTIITSHNKILY